MKKLLVVTAFDNLSQFKYFKYAVLSTSLRNNPHEISYLTIVKNKEQKNIVDNFYNNYLSEYEFQVKTFDKQSPSNFREGQIYWLFSPFYAKNSKYIVQIDNDVLVNCLFSDMINQKNRRNIISGVNIKPSEKWSAVKSSIYKIGKPKFDIYSKKWINAGIAVINVKKWVKFHKNDSGLWKRINEISNFNKENNFRDSDESIIFDLHYKDTGSLDRKYNLRFHSPKTTMKSLDYNDYIFHYFLYKNDGKGGRIKFDLIDHFTFNYPNLDGFNTFVNFAKEAPKLRAIEEKMGDVDFMRYLKNTYNSIGNIIESINSKIIDIDQSKN